MVRTTLPAVVISSTYTGFVVEPVAATAPRSFPTRITARFPAVNGTVAAVADADAVWAGDAVTDGIEVDDEVKDADAEEVGEDPGGSVADEVDDFVDVGVGDAVAEAGTNATLWYSTSEDDGPTMEVHTDVSESYRTT